MTTLRQYIRHRYDTGASWAASNPVLRAGELGIESDAASLRGKYGDGTTAWASLPYTELGQQPDFQAVTFDTAAAVDVAQGQLAWNDDEQTLDLGKGGGVVLQLGSEQLMLCRNSTASTIPNGTAVMFAGTIGNSGRLLMAPMVADGTYPGYVFFGVTTAAIASGEDGFVATFGKVRQVNTLAFDEGDILWCDPATPGGFTATEPAAPNLKLPVAAVISKAINGILMVRADTGRRLQDLHDVETSDADDGDVLTWNDTANRWEHKPPVNGTAPRSVTIAGPQVDDAFTLFRTSRETTITSVIGLVSGGSVAYELRYATDRTTAGTLATVPDTVTNTTTGDTATVQNQPIPAGRWVWLKITGVTGTVAEFSLSVAF